MLLSKRLEAVARLVPPGSRVIDVGTDHGYVPVWLVSSGISDRALAADIAPNPLDKARQTAAEYGCSDRIDFILCDGLAGCDPDGVDTVIIAGMGGETIAGILDRAPWTREKRLILQPMTKPEILRRWLTASGYAIGREVLAEDAGRIYPILTATGGDSPPLSEAEFQTGQTALFFENPLADSYLDHLIKRAAQALDGLRKSAGPGDTPKREGLEAALAGFEAMKKERGAAHASGQ